MNLIIWNIQSCRGCDGRVDPRRIAGVCRDMADFDVPCLQEVARNYSDLPGSAGEDIAGRVEDVAVNLDTDASEQQPVLSRLKD